ncbi:hypothetical protein HCN44_011342 [Aphidius gifuensis]|uniref:RRM domain-containing protein n=1 Tax=Aphidius gifuensis TaxID=684658 RepID=A0A834XXC5_APHGI|nr:hypothetical protein HCN44_011342 [Aphidius gifuensis]
MAAENNVKPEPAKPAQQENQRENTNNDSNTNNPRPGGGSQNAGVSGSQGGGGGNRGGGMNNNNNNNNRGRKNSRFSGGRGGNHGGGGPRNNQDMQIKMSDSMIEAEMGNNENNKMGGGGGFHGGRGGGMRGGRGGGRGGPGGPGGNRGGPGGGGGGGGGDGMNRSQEDRLMERIMSIGGPTHELPPQDTSEKKFNGRNRLYIGSLPNDITDEEIQTMFTPFGEISELFLNKEKNFAFVRMDFRVNAEKAKHELDGHMWKGRPLKVRFAPHLSKLKVKNMTPWVSNELLERAFSVFGEIERATVIVDERGQSTCEGIVEYTRKSSAMAALKKCTDGCYFLTANSNNKMTLMVIQIKIFLVTEKGLQGQCWTTFCNGSLRHDGTRLQTKIQKKRMIAEEEKLEAQMEFARYEHETELLRDKLRLREADREHKKRQWEMKEREIEEQRSHEDENRRRKEEDMTLRIHRQEEELHRRQQENNIFMQENNIFMQEQAMRGNSGGGNGGATGTGIGNLGGGNNTGKNYEPLLSNNKREGYGGPDGGNNLPVDPKSFMDSYNMDRSGSNRGGGGGVYNDERGGPIMDLMDMRVDLVGNMGGNNRGNSTGGSVGGGGGGGRWQGGNDRNRQEDYPNKRRRY